MVKHLIVLLGYYIGDIIPRMAVEALLQPLLIHIVANEADAASQHKQGINGANVYVLLRLLTEIIKIQLFKHEIVADLSGIQRC